MPCISSAKCRGQAWKKVKTFIHSLPCVFLPLFAIKTLTARREGVLSGWALCPWCGGIDYLSFPPTSLPPTPSHRGQVGQSCPPPARCQPGHFGDLGGGVPCSRLARRPPWYQPCGEGRRAIAALPATTPASRCGSRESRDERTSVLSAAATATPSAALPWPSRSRLPIPSLPQATALLEELDWTLLLLLLLLVLCSRAKGWEWGCAGSWTVPSFSALWQISA